MYFNVHLFYFEIQSPVVRHIKKKTPFGVLVAFIFKLFPLFLSCSHNFFFFNYLPAAEAQTALPCLSRGCYRPTSQDDRPAGGADLPLILLFLPLSQQRFCISAHRQAIPVLPRALHQAPAPSPIFVGVASTELDKAF